MAHKVVTTLTDDLDPSQTASETVVFSLDGLTYEIDLTSAHARKLREKLAPYAAVGRQLSRAGQVMRRTTNVEVDPKAVRAWAGSNGIELSKRGRVPRAVVDQFRAAMDSP